MKFTNADVPIGVTMDESDSLKANLAADHREIKDLNLRIQNLLLLCRHEPSPNKGNINRDLQNPLATAPLMALTSKVYLV